MVDLVVVGTMALDDIETPGATHQDLLGGSATFAGTAASLFAKVGLVGIVGADFPEVHLQFLSDRGIDTAGVCRSSGKTFHWSGSYDADLSHATTRETHLNALLEFQATIPSSFAEAPFVFLANVDPDLQSRAIDQFTNPKLIVLDTMNYWIETKRESLTTALKRVDVLIINDQEIRMLTGKTNLIQATEAAATLGPRWLIVKKGEHGAMLYHQGQFFSIPAFPVNQLVDPTGAGDSFAGGFLGYLSQTACDEAAFRTGLVMGTLVSSFTVQSFSLEKLASLTVNELKGTFEKFRKTTQFPDHF